LGGFGLRFFNRDNQSEFYVLLNKYGSNDYVKKIIDLNLLIKGVVLIDKLPDFKQVAKRIIKGLKEKEISQLTKHNIKDVEKFSAPIDIIIAFPIRRQNNTLIEELTSNPRINRVIIFDGASYLYDHDFVIPNSDKIVLRDNYFDLIPHRNISSDYYSENHSLFEQTRDWLEDDKSKKTMDLFIEGHTTYKPFSLYDVWDESSVKDQYFDRELIKLSNNEVFVDCGAYVGDTLSDFANRVECFDKYYAFEPDTRRFKMLAYEIDRASVKGDVQHIKKGAWSKKTVLCFSQEKGCGEITERDGGINRKNTISVDCIDNVVRDDDKVSFIKMDIEGAEMEALIGAENTIKRNHPVLAICVYHKKEDLITIPQYIKKLDSNYKIYLRAYYPYLAEVVLYAIPTDR
jgi:FkbM family methyltransferase